MIKTIFILMIAIALSSCSRNVSYIKEHAEKRWSESGFNIVTYEGYQCGIYGGYVYYHVTKKEDRKGIRYSGALMKRGNEIHIYEFRSIDKKVDIE